MLAIVVQALLRIAARAEEPASLRAIALASFVAIFFFALPFPFIILAAGVVGYLGARAGYPAFAPGGGHGASAGAA